MKGCEKHPVDNYMFSTTHSRIRLPADDCPYCEVEKLKEDLKAALIENKITKDNRVALEKWYECNLNRSIAEIESLKTENEELWELRKQAKNNSFANGISRAVEILENEKTVLERYKLIGHVGIVNGLIEVLKAEISSSVN